MAERRRKVPRWLIASLAVLAGLTAAAALIWRDDIMRTSLDPKVPFQTYAPPQAPDYAQRAAWALLPGRPDLWTSAEPPADVFFVSPTTFDGGREWNAPIGEAHSEHYFRRSIGPNYVGPFVRSGRIFAPRYRQASLYSQLTLREDAREARRFAYGDVAVAFRFYRDHYNKGRPLILVGVEQGGTLAYRLLNEEILPNAGLRRQLVAAYLIETVAPAEDQRAPPCVRRGQTGCLAAWATAVVGDQDRGQDLIERSLVWGPGAQLDNLNGRQPMCFNPILGRFTDQLAAARLNLGAANATGLEWGARPAFLTRQVSARCENGILRVSQPKSSLLRPAGSWADRRKVPSYNLFWADIEADAKMRVAALLADPASPKLTPPSPVRKID
jgi:hypothetical protein